jgi:hypothetical protein
MAFPPSLTYNRAMASLDRPPAAAGAPRGRPRDNPYTFEQARRVRRAAAKLELAYIRFWRVYNECPDVARHLAVVRPLAVAALDREFVPLMAHLGNIREPLQPRRGRGQP